LEFLPEQEIAGLLTELGVTKTPRGESCVLMEMAVEHSFVQDCLCKDTPCDEIAGTCHVLDEEKLITATCEVARKIHQGQTVLIPAGKWRSIFDAVAFSMASALMQDGENLEQSLFLVPADAPVLMHIQPGGPVRVWYGNQVLADEISGAYKE